MDIHPGERGEDPRFLSSLSDGEVDVRAYSSPVGMLCHLLMLTCAASVVPLMWKRRDYFPLNIAPFWLQALTLSAAPLSMVAASATSVFYDPQCLYVMTFYSPTLGLVPFCTGALTLLWYAQARYHVQLFRAKLASPSSFRFGYWYILTVIKPRYLLYEFLGLSVLVSVPILCMMCVDYFLYQSEDRRDCAIAWLPAKLYTIGLMLFLTLVALYLGWALRSIREEFQLTKNCAKVAAVYAIAAIPWRMFHFLIGQHFSPETLQVTRVVEVTGWLLAFGSSLYYFGYFPWQQSLRYSAEQQEERRTRAGALGRRDGPPGARRRTRLSSLGYLLKRGGTMYLRDALLAANVAGAAAANNQKEEEEDDEEEEEERKVIKIRKIATAGELRSILDNAVTRKIFKEYSVKEFCVENILFLEALQEYKDCNNLQTKVQTLEQFIHEFLQIGGLNQLNLPMRLRDQLIAKISALLHRRKKTLFYSSPSSSSQAKLPLSSSFSSALHAGPPGPRMITVVKSAGIHPEKGAAAGGQEDEKEEKSAAQLETIEELLIAAEREVLKMLLDPFNRCLRLHPEIQLPPSAAPSE